MWVKETNIRLLYHSETRDWTVIINEVAHDHLTSAAAQDLLEYTMVATEQAVAIMAEPIEPGESVEEEDKAEGPKTVRKKQFSRWPN